MVLKITKDIDIVLVIFDNSSKFGWTVPLKTKNAQTMKDSFENSFISLKRKTNLIETDDGLEVVNKIFTVLLNKNNIKRYGRYTFLGAAFAERFNRTIRDPLKQTLFQQRDVNWIDLLSTITKKYSF